MDEPRPDNPPAPATPATDPKIVHKCVVHKGFEPTIFNKAVYPGQRDIAVLSPGEYQLEFDGTHYIITAGLQAAAGVVWAMSTNEFKLLEEV